MVIVSGKSAWNEVLPAGLYDFGAGSARGRRVIAIEDILEAALESSSRMASRKNMREAEVVFSSDVEGSENFRRSSFFMSSRMFEIMFSLMGICRSDGNGGNVVVVVSGILALLVWFRRRHAGVMLSTVWQSRAMRY